MRVWLALVMLVSVGGGAQPAPLGSFQISHGEDAVICSAISPDETLLATAGSDKIANIVGSVDGKVRLALSHPAMVTSVAFSADSKRLATGCADATIRLWDVASGTQTCELSTHKKAVNSVAFNADGSLLVSGGADCSVRLWDLQKGTLKVLSGSLAEITSVAFTADGQSVMSGGLDGRIRFWTLDGKNHGAVIADSSGVRAVSRSADGKLFGSVGMDGGCRVWDVENGVPQSVVRHAGNLSCISFAPNGIIVAFGCSDHQHIAVTLALSGELLIALKLNDLKVPIIGLHFLNRSSELMFVTGGGHVARIPTKPPKTSAKADTT